MVVVSRLDAQIESDIFKVGEVEYLNHQIAYDFFPWAMTEVLNPKSDTPREYQEYTSH